MKSNAVSAGQEELIGTVDIGQLHEIRWPIMRLLAGTVRGRDGDGSIYGTLLATRHWAVCTDGAA